jgi:hypothetical protein
MARLRIPIKFSSSTHPSGDRKSRWNQERQAGTDRVAHVTPIVGDIADLERENVKVAQSQLRHTTQKITLDLHAQAASVDQQEAHKKVVKMVPPAQFPKQLKARSVIATA